MLYSVYCIQNSNASIEAEPHKHMAKRLPPHLQALVQKTEAKPEDTQQEFSWDEFRKIRKEEMHEAEEVYKAFKVVTYSDDLFKIIKKADQRTDKELHGTLEAIVLNILNGN